MKQKLPIASPVGCGETEGAGNARDQRYAHRHAPGSACRLLLLVLGLAMAAMSLAPSAHAAPNVVLVVTDDQSLETLRYMPHVQANLVDKGVNFMNGFVSNPFCCPSRAAILSGRFSHSTGVYDNVLPYGGFRVFPDTSTLPVWLQAAGYRTALMGKYMNDYEYEYRPPGWSEWYGLFRGGYYGAQVSVNNNLTVLDDSTYGEHWYRQQARSFIESTPAGQPLFLYYAPKAPHLPSEPEAKYRGAFAGLAPFRPPSYDEADVSDKPAWVRAIPPLTPGGAAGIDQLRRDHLETLLSVDDSVAELVDALRDTGRLQDTLFIYTSDNGWGFGQHRAGGKRHAYEESIRVPLVIRYDALTGGTARVAPGMIANVDLAPTIAQLAGVAAPGAEGVSAVGMLQGTVGAIRPSLLLEHADPDQREGVPTYCGVRTPEWKYVQYATREEELYNLLADPHELSNRAADPGARGELEVLRSETRRLCSPQPPGWTGQPVLGGALSDPLSLDHRPSVTWRTDRPERGVVAYDVQLQSTDTRGRMGTWRRWLRATPQPGARLPAALGLTTCVRARSIDSTGNVSGWTLPRCVTRPHAVSSTRAKGPWRAIKHRRHFAGVAFSAAKAGASLKLPVRARELRLVATTCRACGVVDVYFGTRRVKRVSLRSGSLRRRQVIQIATFGRSRAGLVTLRASSKGRPVIVEGIAALR